MRRALLLILGLGLTSDLFGQNAVSPPRVEAKQKAKQQAEKEQRKRALTAGIIRFDGNTAFSEDDLRTALKEQITTISDYGLSAARADDVAFFLELFYRKHGYAKVDVRYQIEGDRVALHIEEGPQFTLGTVHFEGNAHEPADKLLSYVVGPTRERYSQLKVDLPFVGQDVQQGADLVQRFYVAEGFLQAKVETPTYRYRQNATVVDVTIPIIENEQYFFGNVSFQGNTIYSPETLRGQMLDLLKQPYTEARVADIPRRLQEYFKRRGYYDVKVEATGDPEKAVQGRVPVQVALSPGPVYHFDSATVTGLTHLRPGYVLSRFDRLKGKTYSPDVLDKKFRALMKTGLFNLLQINPVPFGNDRLHLQISAEEAKSKELGFSVGYGTYVGGIFGVQYRDLDLFGYGRPLTTSVEINQRGYKGEVLWEDPYLFDTEFAFKARVWALTFDFDGYSKFELGERLEISRDITKQYKAGAFFAVRRVDLTSADISAKFLGQTTYVVNTLGISQTLDLRKSPLVDPRGLVIDGTMDVATNAFGSDIEFVRGTSRVSYYMPFSEPPRAPGVAVVEDATQSPVVTWFRHSMLSFGARTGIIHILGSESTPFDLPIDERFFNGGSTSVRSFAERELGPSDRRGHPLGGEFYTIFNAEYNFPIYGELQGALFFDAGNLLPSSEQPSLAQMRYAIGGGLRYQLPIGPIRFDYGVNPDPQTGEADGAFHFSFGFAF